MSRGRDLRLDRMRIISMILVVTVHAANYYCRAISSISAASFSAAVFFNSAARISVPLFFMISGAVLLGKEYDPKKNRKRIAWRALSLVFITAVFYFWDRYFKGVTDIDVLSLFSGPERTLLWFLYALLGIYIVLPFIKRMTDGMTEREDRLFVILFAVFGGLIYCIGINPRYPVPIVGATYYLGYFVCGRIIYKNLGKCDLAKHRVWCAVLIALCAAAASVIASAACLKRGEYDSSYISNRNIFIMAASFAAFTLLYGILTDKQSTFVKTLSDVSFGVYLFHGIALDLFLKYFPYRSVFSAVGIPVTVAAVSLVTVLFVYLIRKIPGASKLF